MTSKVLENIIKNARKIPEEYREQALAYANEYALKNTWLDSALNNLKSFTALELMAAAAGGVVGYFSGDTLGGMKTGAASGAGMYGAAYTIDWLKTQERAWRALPEFKRKVADKLSSIGRYYETMENPLKDSLIIEAVVAPIMGGIGVPFAGDENTFAIGFLTGLMLAVYHVKRGKGIIEKVENYAVISQSQRGMVEFDTQRSGFF